LPGGPSGGARAELTLPEDGKPIVAEVTADGVAVLAYPKQDSQVRRQANTGDLLRVTGRAPGVDGDTNTWWATTEGFVPLDVLQPASNPHAANWTLPEREAAPNGWWGELNMRARVRTAPTTDAPVLAMLGAGQRVKVLAEEQGAPIDGDATWRRIDGGRFAGGWVHGSTVNRIDQPAPNAAPPDPAPADGTWITVDRAARTLTFVQGGNPVFTTYVAIGKAGAETPVGAHSVVGKLVADDMTSTRNPDALNPYYLPNVPFVQYYRTDGSAIHGTYWHDSFGSPESQGCVNLTITDAAYLFGLTRPEVVRTVAWSASGTPVVIAN
jgi:lipoprotein-anchoring transpeptidase ErfK/SrfK